jgi:hypothetical protein
MTRRLVLIPDDAEQEAVEVRCEWCKHWDADHECGRITNRPGPAIIAADYGYGIALRTTPDYGCSLFEPKETL